MRISVSPAIALFVLTLACTSPLAQDDEAGTTTNPGTTDDSTTSESTTTGTGTDESLNFIPSEDIPYLATCDIYAQDCPEGEKCVPYASSGDTWDALKCVPVLGDQAPGEPCVWAGLVEATDDCDGSSMCWEAYGEATCKAFCLGSLDGELVCPPGSTCSVNQEFGFCEPICDPVAQDCAEGLGCYWANIDFSCIFIADDIPTGEPCGYINDCTPGNLCADAASLPSCAGSACCTQYCNLPDGDAGCLAQPGTACVPFFEMGTAPEGFEHVGVCILPP